MKLTLTYRSDRYKCSIHDVWLELRTVSSSVGTFRFWQCPVIGTTVSWHHGEGENNGRCQTCKPCKAGERTKKRVRR